jgi:hypothetical protein
MKGKGGNIDQGMCPVCRKEEEWSHILRRKEKMQGRNVGEKYTGIDLEMESER